MTQSRHEYLPQHKPPLLSVVLLSVGVAPVIDELLAGRQQRACGWIHELRAFLQLPDDLIRVHRVDRRVAVAVEYDGWNGLFGLGTPVGSHSAGRRTVSHHRQGGKIGANSTRDICQ